MTIFHLLLWCLGSVGIVATLEYITHRYFMHKYLVDYAGLREVFQKHAIVHHRDGRNDLNVDLPIRTHFVWGFPLIAISTYFSSIGATVLCLCFISHAILWTRLHRAIHELESNWTKRLWCYHAVKCHHLEHHRKPGHNFGAVFIFMDRFFGTYSRPQRNA